MVRAAGALVTLGVLATAAAHEAGQVWRRWSGGAPLAAAEMLTGLAAGVAVVLTAWLAVGVVLTLGAGIPGRVGQVAAVVASRAVTPGWLRRVVGCVLGLTVAAGAGPVVCAASAPSAAVVALDRPDPSFIPLPEPGWRAAATAAGGAEGARHGPTGHGGARGVGGGADDALPPDPGWIPDPPLVRPQPDLAVLAPARAPSPTTAGGEVVVRRGDTLWSITERALGPGASDAEVAAAWPAWYAANRDVVGDDPDLLLPGQVLRAPETVTS